MDRTFFTRIRIAALLMMVAGAAGTLGWLWWSCVGRPGIDFLPQLTPAEWIVYPSGPDGYLHPRLEMSGEFRRSFKLDEVPSQAVLRVAGLHRYAVSLNGHALGAPSRPGASWKQPDVFEVSPQLRKGENQIAVTAFNTNGPPAISLSLEAAGLRLNSDENWETCYAGATWRKARLARKPEVALPGSPLYADQKPFAGFGGQWWVLLIFAALSAAVFWFASRTRRIDDRWLVAGLAALWIALFANNAGVLPGSLGFDVEGHLAYVRYLQEDHSFPLPEEGWEMFQGPLYYTMGAGLLGILSLSVSQTAGIVALRWMGLGIGVAHFVLVWASLCLLFPQSRSGQRWGLILAACMPPLLYLSQYITNEALAGTLVSACVYLTLRLLKQPAGSWKAFAGLGLCLGAALLAKTSAIPVVPLVVGALIWQRVVFMGGQPKAAQNGGRLSACVRANWQRFGRIALVLVVAFSVSGWHYARLWYHYGDPFLGVWDPRTGFSWWQEDGYRTSNFYLRFGDALLHPWFAGFKSFAGGIYSTLWGDGLLGGGSGLPSPPPWNYGLMGLGYWLALLPTLVVVLGSVVAIVKFILQPSAEWFLILGLALLVGFAVTQMSLAVPYYCMVKAFYGLSALTPLCALGVCGYDFLSRRSPKLKFVLGIALGVWAMDTFASYWIVRSSNAVVLWRARTAMEEQRIADAIGILKNRLESNPRQGIMRSALAEALAATSNHAEALKEAETSVQDIPEDPSAQVVLGRMLLQQKRVGEAADHFRRAIALAPGYPLAYEDLATLLAGQGSYDEAILVAREGLGLSSFSPELHFALGLALIRRGEVREGRAQVQLAALLKPEWAAPRSLLGGLLINEGKPGEATSQLVEALRLDPSSTEALNYLAWIRATALDAAFRDGPEAVRLAERACRLTDHKDSGMLSTLAAAYAETGRFEDAVAAAQKARELALAAGRTDLAGQEQELIRAFTARQPYREQMPKPAGTKP